MLSEFRNLCGRGQGGHVATPLQEEVGESNLVQVHGNSDFVLGGIRIGMGYMNLVTVIT